MACSASAFKFPEAEAMLPNNALRLLSESPSLDRLLFREVRISGLDPSGRAAVGEPSVRRVSAVTDAGTAFREPKLNAARTTTAQHPSMTNVFFITRAGYTG
jgi:hypothetical protein